MSKTQISIRKQKARRRTGDDEERRARKPRRPEKDTAGLAGLQQQVGNRVVQRLLDENGNVQRQAGGQGAKPNLLDPEMMAAAARRVIAQNEAPVRSWLEANTSRLRLLTMDELVAQVRGNVPEAARLADVEIQTLLQEWAARQDINIPMIPPLGTGSAGPSVQIPEAVKKAFSIAIDGVDVIRLPGGRLNISAKGATAKLRRSDIKLSWGGSLGIDIPMEGFHLAGTLDRNSWEITLSAPGETSLPDLSKLTDVFKEAETAMRGMIDATTGFGSLSDVPKVTKAASPHVAPVKEAVKALVDIAKAPGVSAGLSVRGPTPGGETPGGSTPSGITVTATVTIRF